MHCLLKIAVHVEQAWCTSMWYSGTKQSYASAKQVMNSQQVHVLCILAQRKVYAPIFFAKRTITNTVHCAAKVRDGTVTKQFLTPFIVLKGRSGMALVFECTCLYKVLPAGGLNVMGCGNT